MPYRCRCQCLADAVAPPTPAGNTCYQVKATELRTLSQRRAITIRQRAGRGRWQSNGRASGAAPGVIRPPPRPHASGLTPVAPLRGPGSGRSRSWVPSEGWHSRHPDRRAPMHAMRAPDALDRVSPSQVQSLPRVVRLIRGAPPGALPGGVGSEAGQDARLIVIEHGLLRRRPRPA